MRKIIFTFLLMLSVTAWGQEKSNVHFIVTKDSTNVGFATADGKNYCVVSFPGKKANDLYTDVLLRTVRKFKSMPVAPQTIEGKAFILSGETDAIRHASNGLSGTSTVYLKYNILFEFKDGRIRVHAPEAPSGTEIVLGTGSEYKARLSSIYEKDKDAIAKIEDFFNNLINTVVFPSSDDNW